jgi:hypothetical protein
MRKTRLSGMALGSRRVRGVLNCYYDTRRETYVVRKWPRKRLTRTTAELANQQRFANAIALIKQADPSQIDAAKALVKGTDYLWRDVIMMGVYGTLASHVGPDGTVYESLSICFMQIQNLLDSILNTIGAMLVRGPNGWAGLPIGSIGDVMVVNAEGLPDWDTIVSLPQIAPYSLLANGTAADAFPDGITLSDFLDATFGADAVQNAIIYRDAAGWVLLAPPVTNAVLGFNDSTGEIEWQTGGGGSGGLQGAGTQQIVNPAGSVALDETKNLVLFTGTAGNINLDLPSAPPDGWVWNFMNMTTGGFTIDFTTGAGQQAWGWITVASSSTGGQSWGVKDLITVIYDATTQTFVNDHYGH